MAAHERELLHAGNLKQSSMELMLEHGCYVLSYVVSHFVHVLLVS